MMSIWSNDCLRGEFRIVQGQHDCCRSKILRLPVKRVQSVVSAGILERSSNYVTVATVSAVHFLCTFSCQLLLLHFCSSLFECWGYSIDSTLTTSWMWGLTERIQLRIWQLLSESHGDQSLQRPATINFDDICLSWFAQTLSYKRKPSDASRPCSLKSHWRRQLNYHKFCMLPKIENWCCNWTKKTVFRSSEK